MEAFRTKTEERPESTEKPAEVTGIVTEEIPSEPKASTLDEWETMNKSKYGAEYLGIKEITREFPYNAIFSEVDKYIKGEMESRGYDKTPKAWQDILSEIEAEIGTGKMNAIERIKRIRDYIRVIKRMNDLKKKKEAFTLGEGL